MYQWLTMPLSTFTSRDLPFNEHPSATCSATAMALTSRTFVFHNAVAFPSLNSAPPHPQRS